MTTYRRCPNREHPEGKDRFYVKRDGACPYCGDEFVPNAALSKSKLNDQLFGTTERAGTSPRQEVDALAKRIKKESFH